MVDSALSVPRPFATVRTPLGLALILASLFSLWRISQIDHRFLLDDAYITLTFAKNLARGDGFVYNGGPPILGTTTPLFTWLVAACGWLLPSVPLSLLAVLLSGFGLQALIWLPWFFRGELQLNETEAAITGVLLGATGAVHILGMEMYVFAPLLVLTFALYRQGAFLASGFCSGLLFLTRGEGAIAFVILLCGSVLADYRKRHAAGSPDRRAVSVRVSLGFAAPFLAWSLYALRTFGGILPNTLSAKIAQGQSGLWSTFRADLFFQWLPEWSMDVGIPGLHTIGAWPVLVLLGSISIVRSRPGLRPLLLWCLLYVAGYSILGVSSYSWYSIPIYTVLTVAAGIGVSHAAAWLSSLPGLRSLGVATPIAVVALVAISLAGRSTPPGPGADVFKRGTAYLHLAGWIRENVEASSTVAYHEIGYLGYHTESRIIDVVGLIHEDLVQYIGNQDFVTGFWRYEPDYLIYPDGTRFIGMIVSTPPFMDTYTPVARLPGVELGESFIIFRHGRGLSASRLR